MPTFRGQNIRLHGGANAGRGYNPHSNPHSNTYPSKPQSRGNGQCSGAGCSEVATEKSYSGDPMCLNCHQKYDERDS